MKTIVHLSDLHFGKVDQKRIRPILSLIARIDPDIVVISGDLTQRAKEKEFIAARKFLETIGKPIFVVPGNHDIPLYNLFRRFISPFKRYLKFISKDLAPVYQDDEMTIIGINSVRRSTITSGRINKENIIEAEKSLRDIPPNVLKIIVCHHPFDLPFRKEIHGHTHKVVGRSKVAIEALAKHKVDVFLSGHLHLQHIGDTTIRYKIKGYRGLIVQAGTAISKRGRGEPVSFNVLKFNDPLLEIENYSGDENGAGFSLSFVERYVKTQEGWEKSSKDS